MLTKDEGRGSEDPGEADGEDAVARIAQEALLLTALPPRRAGRLKGEGRGEEPSYTPFIQINHDDPVNPTGVFYLSPDLWVDSSLGRNLPVQGEENRVSARVHNRGLMDAFNVNVRFYWADPSAAITDATAHPIGGSDAAATATGVFIPAAAGPGLDSSVVVPCPSPWVPQQATHECLLAKAWCPGQDPNAPPFVPVLDPVNDRRSAQHNVTVTYVAPAKGFAFSVEVANISGLAQPVRVLVRALEFRQAAERLVALGVPLPDGLRESARPFPIEAWLSREASFLHRGHAAFARTLIAAGEGREARVADRGKVLAELGLDRLAPWERRRVEVRGEVPGWAKPGEVLGLEVTEVLGDFATGGYVALVVVGEGPKAPR